MRLPDLTRRARTTRALALAAAVSSLALSLACAKTETVDPLRLDGNRLSASNRTGDDWHTVQILINRQYRIVAPVVLAGQRFDVSLDAFLDVYGNHFYYQRHPITDVHLTATLKSGAPVDVHMDFHRSGLAGLADVGVFKKKESK